MCSHLGYHHRLNIQKFCLFRSWGYLYPQLEGTEQNLVGWARYGSSRCQCHPPHMGSTRHMALPRCKEAGGKEKFSFMHFLCIRKDYILETMALICPGSKALPRQTASPQPHPFESSQTIASASPSSLLLSHIISCLFPSEGQVQTTLEAFLHSELLQVYNIY